MIALTDLSRMKAPTGSYRLEGRTPVPCTSMLQWVMSMEETHHVARTLMVKVRLGPKGIELLSNYYVSTVFLGLDHSHGAGSEPLVFESMIHNKISDEWLDYQTRCPTWKVAERMHITARRFAKGDVLLDPALKIVAGTDYRTPTKIAGGSGIS